MEMVKMTAKMTQKKKKMKSLQKRREILEIVIKSRMRMMMESQEEKEVKMMILTEAKDMKWVWNTWIMLEI